MNQIFLSMIIVASPLLAAGAAPLRVSQDGSGDFDGRDESPLRGAIARARSAGGGEIIISEGQYVVSKEINLDGLRHVRIRGEGRVTLKLAPALVTELSAPAAVGDHQLALASTLGLREGLKLRILAPGDILAVTGKPKPTFECVVASVDNNTVRLKEPLAHPAPAGTCVLNDKDLNLFTTSSGCEDVILENLTLDGGLETNGVRQPTHQTRCGIWVQGRFDYLKGPTAPKPRFIVVRDCRLRHFHGRGVAIYCAEDCSVENNMIEDTLDEGIDLDHFAVRCRAVGNQIRSTSVGIELNDANDCLVSRNVIEDCPLGIRLWRYCKLPDLNQGNLIAFNHLRGISGLAVDLQAGTSRNTARHNLLQMDPSAKTAADNHFRNLGQENQFENNRLERAR